MEDHELIGRYVAEELSEAEERMVETRMVQDPSFRNEVELTAALRRGMRELDRRGEVPQLLAATSAGRRSGFALAAAVAAIAAGLATVYFAQERGTPAPTVVTLEFQMTRGADEADVTWVRPATPVRVEMRFDPGPQPAAAYAVTLSRMPAKSGSPTLERTVATSPSGFVVLGVDGNFLLSGSYEIRLEPQPAGAAGEAIVYSLVVED